MKKIILKTALITVGVTLILAISAFGITSFCAPAVMMDLTDSLGLESISGDYAYQEYQHSRDISYLARSFEIAAECGNDAVAGTRFNELYQHEDFSSYCDSQNDAVSDVMSDKVSSDNLSEFRYRDYICGQGACVMYRLARTDDEKADVYVFALSETSEDFSPLNPLIQLSVEAIGAVDAAFCSVLLNSISTEEKFARFRSEDDSANVDADALESYNYIISELEGVVNE